LSALRLVTEELKTRLSVDLSDDLARRVHSAIPWGMKSLVIRILLEALVKEIETNGEGILGKILAREFSVADIVQILNVRDKP